MHIERATSAGRINEILNHPRVRPWVADAADGVIDISETVGNPQNVCLVGQYGAFVCFKFFAGTYEVHTAILPEGRGRWAKEFAEAGAHFMFTATDCIEILTRVPDGHVAAAVLTRMMDFQMQFSTPPECLFLGKLVRCSIYALSIQDWAKRVSAESGARFHDWLNVQVKTGDAPHAPDDDHNRIVGITLDMFRAGQAAKATAWYNRYALAARHPPILLISREPPRIKFDAGILTLDGDEIGYEPCH